MSDDPFAPISRALPVLATVAVTGITLRALDKTFNDRYYKKRMPKNWF